MNCFKPYFSVIIPVYNKAPHLERSIGSVLNQTFGNFELIIVDDASTDESSMIIHSFKDERVSCYRRDNPGPGGYAARNLGINKAAGKYIAFLDADDEWRIDHLENYFKIITENNGIEILGCGYSIINGKMECYDDFFLIMHTKETVFLSLIDFLKYVKSGLFPINCSTACILNNPENIVNLFPSNHIIARGGDRYAWIKLMCKCRNMIWSNHQGAIYHTNSVNRVSLSSTHAVDFFSIQYFDDCIENLSIAEVSLLQKIINRSKAMAWINNKHIGIKQTSIIKKLDWRNDFINATIFWFISIIPSCFFIKFKELWKKLYRRVI